MRHALIVAAVGLLVSACIAPSASSEPSPEPPRDDNEPRTSVSVLAKELHLSPDYERERDRVVLEGKPGRVVLYPGTTVVLVNGARVAGTGRIGRWGDEFTVKRSDVRLISSALNADAKRDRSGQTGVSNGATPRVTSRAPDPKWDVTIRRTWKYIVIHHSATDSGSAASFDRSHRKRGWDGLGYHFVIGNGSGTGDGVVEVGYRWTQQVTGAHAGRPRPDVNLLNEQGIGICLVGNFNSSKPTRKQQESLHRLIDWLSGRCGIPRERVLVHRDVKGTECPGQHFPAQEFLAPRRDVPRAYR